MLVQTSYCIKKLALINLAHQVLGAGWVPYSLQFAHRQVLSNQLPQFVGVIDNFLGPNGCSQVC